MVLNVFKSRTCFQNMNPKQMPQRLPIAFEEVKAGKTF